MRLEKGNSLAKAAKKSVDDLGVLFHKREAGGYRRKPNHGQEIDIDHFHAGAARENVCGRRHKRSVGFSFLYRVPMRRLTAEALKRAFSQQAVLLDKKPGVKSRVLALRRNVFAAQIGNFMNARVGAHDHAMV
jgi:hypothetical protein